MIRVLIASAIAVLAIVAVCSAQQPASKPASPYDLVSPAALDAFRRYQVAETAARRVYDATVADAVDHLVADLRQLQDRMTKAGNLDEAVRLRTAVADLAQGKPPVRAKADAPDVDDAGHVLFRVLPGTTWKSHDGWTMTLHKDMSATSTHHRAAGTWAVVDVRTIRLSISMHNCGGYPVTVSPDGTKLVNPQGNVQFTLAARP